MELYHVSNDEEKRLQAMADQKHIPLGGSIELLPLCNMSCKMCYVRQTKAEMDAAGKMLSCDQWIEIARQACKEGVLFLLLTGGEPLLYPEFRRLYHSLKQMGLVLSVNTNGTLIDEEWADFFAKEGCRRLNITLYGKDDETYARLCQNPKGFTQVMRAVELLKARHVAFRLTCSITPDNVEQMEDIYRIAKEIDAPLSVATYMFPAARRGKRILEQNRLTPEEAAHAMLKSYQLEHPEVDLRDAAYNTLMRIKEPPVLLRHEGFMCHAGHSGFWLNWKGEMMACGMFNEPKISLLEHTFQECWRHIVERCRVMPQCEECKHCIKQNICRICPASMYTETEDLSQCPEYLCRMTDEEIRIYLNLVKAEDPELTKRQPDT